MAHHKTKFAFASLDRKFVGDIFNVWKPKIGSKFTSIAVFQDPLYKVYLSSYTLCTCNQIPDDIQRRLIKHFVQINFLKLFHFVKLFCKCSLLEDATQYLVHLLQIMRLQSGLSCFSPAMHMILSFLVIKGFLKNKHKRNHKL